MLEVCHCFKMQTLFRHYSTRSLCQHFLSSKDNFEVTNIITINSKVNLSLFFHQRYIMSFFLIHDRLTTESYLPQTPSEHVITWPDVISHEERLTQQDQYKVGPMYMTIDYSSQRTWDRKSSGVYILCLTIMVGSKNSIRLGSDP